MVQAIRMASGLPMTPRAFTAKRASACPLAAARCMHVQPRISWINLGCQDAQGKVHVQSKYSCMCIDLILNSII